MTDDIITPRKVSGEYERNQEAMGNTISSQNCEKSIPSLSYGEGNENINTLNVNQAAITEKDNNEKVIRKRRTLANIVRGPSTSIPKQSQETVTRVAPEETKPQHMKKAVRKTIAPAARVLSREDGRGRREKRNSALPRYAQATRSFSLKSHSSRKESIHETGKDRKEDAPRGRKTLTRARDMKLQTNTRAKFRSSSATASSRKVLSQAERDDLFMKSLKPFKARKVNKKIMSSNGDIGLPKIGKKKLTEFKTFKFKTSSRGERLRLDSKSDCSSMDSGTLKDRSLLSRKNPPLRKSKTVAQPFRRSMERHMLSQEIESHRRKIQELEIKKQIGFKANPLPDFSQRAALPKPVEKKVTVAKTPKVLVKSRLSGEMFQRKVDQERIQQLARTNFIAHGLPETTYTPEKVKQPAAKGITIAMTPHLNSEERAEERKEFEKRVHNLKESQKREEEALLAKKKEDEERKLKEYRRSLIHKALPLPFSSFHSYTTETE